MTQKEPALRPQTFPVLSLLSLFSSTCFSPRRRKVAMRPTDKAVAWRSWRTGPTRTALVALGSTPTRCIMWACTSLAGSAPSCPRQLCGWWRSPGTPTPTPEPGVPASTSSACHLLGELLSMCPGTLLAGSTPAPLKTSNCASHMFPSGSQVVICKKGTDASVCLPPRNANGGHESRAGI